MSRLTLTLLFGVLLVGTALAGVHGAEEDDIDDEDVVVVTEGNFEEVVGGSKYALVEFYAPWCGHCKNLAPHYAEAATKLKEYDPEIVIAKVDATENGDLASKFDVKGYPTLKWFVAGELSGDYGGGRDTEGIVTWIKKKTGPFAVTLETTEKLDEMKEDAPVVVVAYYKSFEGDAYNTFKMIAIKSEDLSFAQTSDAAIAKAAGLTEEGVVLIKNFEGEEPATVAFEGAMEADEFKAFLIREKMPLTIEFSSANSEKIFNSGIAKQIIYWGNAASLSADSAAFQALKAVAGELKGELVFVTANNEGADHEPITNYFGLQDKEGPLVYGFHLENNKKYKFAGEITTEALKAFATSVADGTAEPVYKSADIPDSPTEEGVTVIVGKNFNDIVLDETKDVLLEVYAPWCGHCKKLAPIYSKLAKRFAKVDSVVIAKMDGTENEHAMVDAKGFPTILFYPAKKLEEGDGPIVFEGGDRSLKALTKFIKQHAEVEYELPKKSDESSSEEDKKDEL